MTLLDGCQVSDRWPLGYLFLIIRDTFKILCIQFNFPAYKDYLCSKFKWFDSHQIFLKKNGKNVILGHIAVCIVVFQQISVYL